MIFNKSCLMEDADEKISSVDREKKALCSKCRSNSLVKEEPKFE